MYKKQMFYLIWMIRFVGLYNRRWIKIRRIKFYQMGGRVDVIIHFMYKKKVFITSLPTDDSFYNLKQIPGAFVRAYKRTLKRINQ